MSIQTPLPSTSPSSRRPLLQRAFEGPRRALRALIVLAIIGFIVTGAVGATRYVWTFWLYRGYPAPTNIASVWRGSGINRRSVPVIPGVVEHISVQSKALGGKRIPVIVYLPPGYRVNPAKRYPVLYLLHGFPGAPAQFINVGDVATLSNTLTAEGKVGPMIIVMPSGTTSFLVDTEWANSVQARSGWETFVAHDLVRAIDTRFRTIPRGASRAIGGLSEGAYGALNIAFHHIGEFRLVEAWSPYYKADRSPVFFGRNPRLLAYNSPTDQLNRVATKLRSSHSYIWIYCGTRDYTTKGSEAFAARLTSLGVAHHFSIQPGRHTWALWRSMMPSALEIASAHLAHA